MDYVVVESSARLHLGFYNFYEDGIAYGGLGVAIELPIVRVKIFKADRLTVLNRTDIDVSDIVDNIVKRLNVNEFGVEILKAIPRHVGLGSTTQTALSIGYGVSKLFGFNYSVRELAYRLGRGRDSGIGIAVFESGGFVVDSGRWVGQGIVEPPRSVNDLPQPIFRFKIPRNWYFLVFIPKGLKGFDERSERKAMDTPTSLPSDIQKELYKLVILHIIPSILRKDIEVFGKAITKLQLIVGEYFSKYQGGIFCCKESEFIVNTMTRYGVAGVGQSSWGPTVYGVVKGREKALRILSKVLRDINSKGYDVEYYVVKARNRGAQVLRRGEVNYVS